MMTREHGIGVSLLRRVCVLACACGVTASAQGVELVSHQPYLSPGAPLDVLHLDVYKPSVGDLPSKQTTIILLHGGSYDGGRKEDLWTFGVELARLGYTVILPNYTLTTSTYASFPQAVRDTMNVVYWGRTTGASMFDVPTRVVLGGFSAGSTIGMAAAMAAPQFTSFPPPDQRGYVIDGAIAVSGRYDLVWNAAIGIPATVSAYLGVPYGAPGWTLTYASASAIGYVNACSPPTALFHGSGDGLVPSGNAVRLAGALTAATVPNELNIVLSGSHDPAGVLGSTPAARAARIDQAVMFILQNGQSPCGRTALPPPPPPTGSCCQPDGGCDVVLQAECTGSWRRNATCQPNVCPQPGLAGACCIGATCAMLTPEACFGPRTRFTGSTIECGTLAMTPCCKADFNQDGSLSVSDVFDFLNLWFIADPITSTLSNGTSAPTVNDIFQYLNDWFVGCG